MRSLISLALPGLLIVAGFALSTRGEDQRNAESRPEVTLSEGEIARLSIFEDRALAEADAAFNRQDYDGGYARYAAFTKRFPDSPVAAYALLRKARCAELAGRGEAAATDYRAVIEQFPDSAKYAAPALFHLAACQLADGNREEAVKAWTTLASREGFRESPLAAAAKTQLIEAVAEGGEPGEVLQRYEQLGMDWRSSENEAVQGAIDAVVKQHVRIEPDEGKLRGFYQELEEEAGERPEQSAAYWDWVVDQVLEHGRFGYTEKEERREYYEFWVGVIKGGAPESEDLEIAVAKLQYGADRDRDKLAERLDALFEQGRQDGDFRRILKWIRAYKGNWSKTREYASKLDYATTGIDGIGPAMDVLCNQLDESYLARFAFRKFCEGVPFEEISNEEIGKLIAIAQDTLEDNSTAKNLVEKLHFEKMSEAEKLALARSFLGVDGDIVLQVYAQLDDPGTGLLELFAHYTKSGDTSGAIAVAGQLAELEEYAEQFSKKRAELLFAAGRYPEAAEALKKCGDGPDVLWKIVECYLAADRPEQAIEQLRTIVAKYPGQAAKAKYSIAGVYEQAEQKEKQVTMLREIVRQHPGSSEAEQAERELGDLGIPPSLPEEPALHF